MSEVQQQLNGKVDRASVYRTIYLFETRGIIKRVLIGWKHKFELSEAFINHHHHATCIVCGKVIKIDEDQFVEKQLNIIADSINFKLTEHSLELRGTCSSCR